LLALPRGLPEGLGCRLRRYRDGGRIPYDLRRSGVKHYINAGVPPHIVMQWSGHRTLNMLLRYNIITLEELRRAGKKASDYRGPDAVVKPLRTVTVRSRSVAEAL
jgi:integrase